MRASAVNASLQMHFARAYPLRYWLLVAYTAGIPGFIRFDASGRTHEYGLFNPYALTTIALTLICLFLFTILTVLSRQPLLMRPIHFACPLWLTLLGLFALSSLLEPAFRLTPAKPTDLFLSLYRLLEWVLAFLMFLSLYSRQPADRTFEFVAGLVARVCWTLIAIVWLVLPFAPSFAYAGGSEDNSKARLGGMIIHPETLGVLSAIACLHALILMRGTRRAVAVVISCLTLFLTYARGAQVTLILLLLVLALVFSEGLPRLLGVVASFLSVGSALVFAPTIITYATRGNGLRNIVTLSDRVQVWTAAIEAIRARPWIGYGFVAGVKGAIKDHWKYTYWVPPHAHNDLIQALISGGFGAGLVLLILYGYMFRSAFRVVRFDRRYTFLLLSLIQLTSLALLAPLTSNQFGVLSGLFVFCSVLVIDQAATNLFKDYVAFHGGGSQTFFGNDGVGAS